MLYTNFEFKILESGNRHCPSLAIFADNKFPSLSFKMIEYESLNNGFGKHNKNHINNPKKIINATLVFLYVVNGYKKVGFYPDLNLLIKHKLIQSMFTFTFKQCVVQCHEFQINFKSSLIVTHGSVFRNI